MEWKTKCSLLYCGLFVLVAIIVNTLGAYIPYLAEWNQIPESSFSSIFFLRGVGFIGGNLLCVRLSGSQDSHLLLAVACGIQGASAFLMWRSLTPWVIGLEYMLLQFGVAWSELLCQSCLLEVHGKGVDKWMQVLHFSYGLGAIAGPFMVIIFEQSLFLVLGVVSVLLFVICISIESPSRKNGPEEVDEAARMGAWETWVAGCWFLLYIGIEVGYGGWLPTFAVVEAQFSKQSAGSCASIYWIFLSLGRLVAAFLSHLYRASYQQERLMISCLSVAVLNGACYLLGYPGISAVVGSAAFGLSISAMYPLMLSCLAEQGVKLTTRELSLFVMLGALGESVVPWLLGILIQAAGMGSLMLALVCFAAGLVLLHYRLVGRPVGSEPLLAS
jgi:FHS family glucose/mannose:H+ symporter-like MFS transporter